MRALTKITADLKKVNYRLINLNAQLANATISQTRLIRQRLETLDSVKLNLELEYKVTNESLSKPSHSIH